MASTKLVIGGAAASAIGVRVARSLYGHWRLLPRADRERIAAFAEDTKEKALSLRGSTDRGRAEDGAARLERDAGRRAGGDGRVGSGGGGGRGSAAERGPPARAGAPRDGRH